jgi:hypothetical protein
VEKSVLEIEGRDVREIIIKDDAEREWRGC